MTIVPRPLARPAPPRHQPDGACAEMCDVSVRSNTRTEQALVGTVQDLIGLGLLAMQFHWHPGRPTFRPVHDLLDDIADRALQAADSAAERAVVLGETPDAHPDRHADTPTFDVIVHRARSDITTFEGILDILAAELHAELDRIGDASFVHDLLTGIAVEVDKHASAVQDLR